MTPVACPCRSGRPYASCCAPFHEGAEPPDAEALMRSRYAAYVRGDAAYLFRTLHRDHDDHAAGAEAHARSLTKSAKTTRYESLRVLDHDAPDADGIARVLFHVTMKQHGKDTSFAELSSFAHDGVGWRYVGGTLRPGKTPSDVTIESFLARVVKE